MRYLWNHRIRKIDAKTKIISTVAGRGRSGFAGDGGEAINAKLNCPHSVAITSAGHIIISDTWNRRIRRVDARTGFIYTIAGTGEKGYRGDEGFADEAQLYMSFSIAVRESDVASQNSVRMLKPIEV